MTRWFGPGRWRRCAGGNGDVAEPLTLENAASRMRVVGRAEAAPAGLVLGGLLPDGAASLFRDWHSSALAFRQYELEDVVLDRRSMVFLKNGRPIGETAYSQPPGAVEALTVRPADLVPAPPNQPVMAACFDHWHSNYYHWLVHSLPTLALLRRDRFAGALILPGLAPWQAETLRLAGFDPARAVHTELDRQYAFRTVLYTDFVRGRADFSVLPASRRAYRAMAARVGVEGTPALFLFISRGGAGNRSVANEAELAAALEADGFTVVQPERLSVAEQIRLFGRARMVVGALGAGMANAAWCRPGTVVIELVPDHHRNPCTLALCMQMDLPYWGEAVETGVNGEDHVSASTRGYDVPAILHRVRALKHRLR